MAEKHDLSIIIRTLNEELSILKCLEALNNQTQFPHEVIIIDNKSTDETKNLVLKAIAEKRFQNLNLKIIDNDIRGYSSGLNIGAKSVKTKYIAYLSADCIISTDWIKNLMNIITKNNFAAVSAGKVIYPQNEIHNVINKNEKLLISNEKYTLTKNISNSQVIYDLEILKQFLPFYPEVGGEDTVMSMKLIKHGYKLAKINNVSVLHNKYSGWNAYKHKLLNNGKIIRFFLTNYPTKPRTYLNGYFWAMADFYYGFRHFKKNYFKAGIYKLYYTSKGFIK